jgi:hypothetical protein
MVIGTALLAAAAFHNSKMPNSTLSRQNQPHPDFTPETFYFPVTKVCIITIWGAFLAVSVV